MQLMLAKTSLKSVLNKRYGMYLSYDMTETYIDRQDYMISMLRTKEVLPPILVLICRFDFKICQLKHENNFFHIKSDN